MTEEEKAAVLKESYFYHVTLQENLVSIMANGLDPQRSEPSTYWPWLKGPAVFLCTNRALPRVKAMFEDGIRHSARVVLKVPATALIEHECDVDRTFPAETYGLSFLECLKQVGFIACLGKIPADALEVVEHY